ncbi:mitochondrial ubiquitin ligase activator of nfkb 1-A [Aulostomus maculatus]
MDGFPMKIGEGVCLGVSVALSSLCYYLYRKSRLTVDRLDGAPHLNINGNLKNIFSVCPGKCLQYAVIEGTVQPLGEPLKSQFQKETVGVLQKFLLREHTRVWSSISHTWVDSERVLLHRADEVPFMLVGSDDIAVKVLHPLQASGVHMEVTHEKFHQVDYGLGDILGQYLRGEKLKGKLETEEMLKVGTALTGVGELVLDTDGTLYLQPPSDGSQYFLSISDFDTLRGEQESTAAGWKTLAVAFALVGAAVTLWITRRYYQQLKLRREREKARREFERLQAETKRERTERQDSAEEQIENPCLICLSQPRNCIVLDCGHVCFCHDCFQALPKRQCPICRQDISRVLPLFYA